MNASQVLNAYRVKLRDGLPGSEGDEIVRQRVEEFANKMRPTGLLVCIGVATRLAYSNAPPLP